MIDSISGVVGGVSTNLLQTSINNVALPSKTDINAAAPSLIANPVTYAQSSVSIGNAKSDQLGLYNRQGKILQNNTSANPTSTSTTNNHALSNNDQIIIRSDSLQSAVSDLASSPLNDLAASEQKLTNDSIAVNLGQPNPSENSVQNQSSEVGNNVSDPYMIKKNQITQKAATKNQINSNGNANDSADTGFNISDSPTPNVKLNNLDAKNATVTTADIKLFNALLFRLT